MEQVVTWGGVARDYRAVLSQGWQWAAAVSAENDAAHSFAAKLVCLERSGDEGGTVHVHLAAPIFQVNAGSGQYSLGHGRSAILLPTGATRSRDWHSGRDQWRPARAEHSVPGRYCYPCVELDHEQ